VSLRVLLVRHGAHDLLGRVLCGRMDGVPLNAEGLLQADRLATILARETIAALYASPLQRAQQTATPIAQTCGVPLQTEPALNEIDVGAWTGATFAALKTDPRWPPWNAARLHHRPPGGESMLEAQCRIAAWLDQMAADPADRCIVAVSHADVIKAACCHALGLSVDAHARFDVDTASVTTVSAGPWGMKLTSLNAG
jgi:broad specificity phosphatase PhoE